MPYSQVSSFTSGIVSFIVIGNAVGSNVFNILSVLGFSAVISPIDASEVRIIDLAIMMFFTILILPLSKSKFQLRRWEGALLFIGYVIYIS